MSERIEHVETEAGTGTVTLDELVREARSARRGVRGPSVVTDAVVALWRHGEHRLALELLGWLDTSQSKEVLQHAGWPYQELEDDLLAAGRQAGAVGRYLITQAVYAPGRHPWQDWLPGLRVTVTPVRGYARHDEAVDVDVPEWSSPADVAEEAVGEAVIRRRQLDPLGAYRVRWGFWLVEVRRGKVVEIRQVHDDEDEQ